jgi:RNA polymerase sigma-70 factor (ECF subfamily)
MTAITLRLYPPVPPGDARVAEPPASYAPREAALSTDIPEDDDRHLIARAQAGEEIAFRDLVERYKKRAYWVAYHLVGDEDDARDIAQEAFIRVFRSIASFDLRYKFYTWLYRIVTNLAVDTLRKRGGQKRVSIEDVGDLRSSEVGPHDGLERAELKERVGAVLKDLPPKYRAVIVLREIEGFSSKEIADMVGSTHATVRWRLHRARSLFREAWEKRFGAGPDMLGAGGSSPKAEELGHEV